MKVAALLLCICFAAFAAAQTAPTWPTDFSATLLITGSFIQSPFPLFVRWYYSQTLNQERFDGLILYQDSPVFAERIFDVAAENETVVYYSQNLGTAVCFTGSFNYPLVKPQFSNFKYIGQSLVDYDITNLYLFAADGVFAEYWTDAASGEPKRFDFNNATAGFNVAYDFLEFDEGPQDPSLFVIPNAIESTCTQVNRN